MSDLDFSPERFAGFGSQYNDVRPSPSAALADLLCSIAQCATPRMVVDLGSGTGLSTRYWAGRAGAVVGVEPADSMRLKAEQSGGANISYRRGCSHATGLETGCADIVVCAQALHWMEPEPTFAESARILRPGGVFAACDYDWPPSTSFWEVDLAYTQCMEHARRLERERGAGARLQRWDKAGHISRMNASGCFRYTREMLLHHQDEGGAERLVGLFLSQSHVQALLKQGFTEKELQLDILRDVAARAFGSAVTRWFWSTRVRLGVK